MQATMARYNRSRRYRQRVNARLWRRAMEGDMNERGAEEIVDTASEVAQRANMMARAALIIAAMAIALSILGLFLPL